MKMKKKTLIELIATVLIIVIGIVVMTGLGSTTKESHKIEVPEEVRLVQTQSVNFGDMVLDIEGNGVVESQRTLNVVSEVSGPVLFAKNNLKDGIYVKEGEIVLEIDSREIENSLYTMRSEYLNSIAAVLPEIKIEDINAYKKWYDYFKNLNIHQTTPELPDIANLQENIKLSTRNIFNKYYAVKNQEILLSKYKFVAPYAAHIESNGIIEGSFVSRGQHLFTLNDAYNCEITVPLLVEEVGLLDFSTPPSVEIFPDKNKNDILTGKIYRKETLMDRNSQSLNVYVNFRNSSLSPYFLPGNYVTVKISGKKFANVAKIPRYVVDSEHFIYTMEDGKLARRKVDLVTIQRDVAVIKNTVPEDMKIVTTILQKPLIGMKIKSANESIEIKEEKSVDEQQLSNAN